MKKSFKKMLFPCLGMFVTTLVVANYFTVPNPPKRPNVINITATSCTLTYEEPFDGGSPITGYLIEGKGGWLTRWKKMGVTSELQHKVTGIVEGSKMQFRVSAGNIAGMSKPSEPTALMKFTDPVRPY